jgi:hypothetical protein
VSLEPSFLSPDFNSIEIRNSETNSVFFVFAREKIPEC